jgi:group I intron endonuclease
MEKQATLYKIENLINGKIYVGQTVRKYNRRMYEHRRKLRNNYHDNSFLQNAWNKYGEKAFKFSIIVECSIDEIDDVEVKWVSFYKTKNLSYNLESGGKNHKQLHEQTKEKLSERTKSLGWNGGNHPMARKVICIDSGKIYDSVIEASEDIGASYKGLYQVLNGSNRSVKGKDGRYYQFSFFEDGMNYVLENINKKRLKNPKKVVCVNTGEVFLSTREAAEKMNVLQSKISLCCNGKRNYTGKLPDGTKLEWKFCD